MVSDRSSNLDKERLVGEEGEEEEEEGEGGGEEGEEEGKEELRKERVLGGGQAFSCWRWEVWTFWRVVCIVFRAFLLWGMM